MEILMLTLIPVIILLFLTGRFVPGFMLEDARRALAQYEQEFNTQLNQANSFRRIVESIDDPYYFIPMEQWKNMSIRERNDHYVKMWSKKWKIELGEEYVALEGAADYVAPEKVLDTAIVKAMMTPPITHSVQTSNNLTYPKLESRLERIERTIRQYNWQGLEADDRDWYVEYLKDKFDGGPKPPKKITTLEELKKHTPPKFINEIASYHAMLDASEPNGVKYAPHRMRVHVGDYERRKERYERLSNKMFVGTEQESRFFHSWAIMEKQELDTYERDLKKKEPEGVQQTLQDQVDKLTYNYLRESYRRGETAYYDYGYLRDQARRSSLQDLKKYYSAPRG